jgi:hypothetical protein
MKRAIIIGINYTGEAYALPDCERDADMMAAMLESHGVDTYYVKRGECSPNWLLSHLTITEATRQKPGDTLYLYFSGHGTQFPDPTEPSATGEAICLYSKKGGIILLKDNDLIAALDRVPGTKIVFFDSCFSGGMNREAMEPQEGMQKKYLAFDPETMVMFESIAKRDVFRMGPQYFLFACAEEQVSYSTGNGGAFTLALNQCARLGYRSLSKILKWTKVALIGSGQTPTAHVVGGSYSKRML